MRSYQLKGAARWHDDGAARWRRIGVITLAFVLIGAMAMGAGCVELSRKEKISPFGSKMGTGRKIPGYEGEKMPEQKVR